MVHYVCVIQSLEKDWIYVGMSNNVERRLSQHQKGESKSTAPYIPFKLLFQEKYDNSNDARAREKYLKTASGKRFIRKKYVEEK